MVWHILGDLNPNENLDEMIDAIGRLARGKDLCASSRFRMPDISTVAVVIRCRGVKGIRSLYASYK